MKTGTHTQFYYKKEEISSHNFNILVLFTVSFWFSCFFGLLAIGEISDSIVEIIILRFLFLLVLVSIPVLLKIRVQKYRKNDPLISIHQDYLEFHSEIIKANIRWDNIKNLTYSNLIPVENRSKCKIWIINLKDKKPIFEGLKFYEKMLAMIFETIHGSPLIIKLKEIDIEESDFREILQAKTNLRL